MADSQEMQAEVAPRHGDQGDRRPAPPTPRIPTSVTIALSREAGSRGGSIARRVGVKLGWQVYSQDMLEYIAQEGSFGHEIGDSLSPEMAQWIDERLDHLLRTQEMTQHPSMRELARILLTLGASGESILLVRGAGFVLPRTSTLHVRIVAPVADRVAYMSQWLRLTEAQAADEIHGRDQRRAEFVTTHFQRELGDPHNYDLVVNSSHLGEELCAELIVQAARSKLAQYVEQAS